MRKLAVTIAALAASALPASAQTLFNSTGPWTVLDFSDACGAINRSLVEFNAAPFNALGFHQTKSDDLPRLQVFFWPGAFKEGDPVQIFVTPAGGQPVELPSVAGSPFHSVSIDPAPEELLESMTVVAQVEIKATDIEPTLVFETAALGDLADLFAQCVSQ